MERFILITFASTHSAMKSEKILAEMKPIMMPTLRQISSSCGMSLKIAKEHYEKAKLALEEGGITGHKFFDVVEENKDFRCEELKA